MSEWEGLPKLEPPVRDVLEPGLLVEFCDLGIINYSPDSPAPPSPFFGWARVHLLDRSKSPALQAAAQDVCGQPAHLVRLPSGMSNWAVAMLSIRNHRLDLLPAWYDVKFCAGQNRITLELLEEFPDA